MNFSPVSNRAGGGGEKERNPPCRSPNSNKTSVGQEIDLLLLLHRKIERVVVQYPLATEIGQVRREEDPPVQTVSFSPPRGLGAIVDDLMRAYICLCCSNRVYVQYSHVRKCVLVDKSPCGADE